MNSQLAETTVPETKLILNHVEEKALSLLGDGHNQVDVAAALGVTESRISQLMAEESFRNAVIERRYKNLQKNSERASKIDDAQDRILDKIAKVIPVVSKPMELVRMFEVLNKASQKEKVEAPQVQINQKVVILNMPTKVVHKYTQNSLGQIIEVDDIPVSTAPNSVLYQHKEDKNDRAQISTINAEPIKQLERRKEENSDDRYSEGSAICAEDL